MLHRFVVALNGTGFSVPVEGDLPIRGFYTFRRVQADSAEAAGQIVILMVQQEDRYKNLVEATLKETGSGAACMLQTHGIGHVSWFRWHFTRQPASYVFYGDEEDDG